MKREKIILAFLLLAMVSAAFAEIRVKNGDKIAFLGDSITLLGTRNQTGYVNLVIDGLAVNGVKAVRIPAGVSGNKSNQMLTRLRKDVIGKKPQIMTLSCGVNDVAHRQRGVKLEDYRKNITEIVRQAKAAGIRVCIMTATMIGENAESELNRKLTGYNEFLRELAKAEDCVLIDTNAEMQKEVLRLRKIYPDVKGNLLMVDSLHMNPLGNAVMAKAVLKGFGLSDEQIAKAEAGWGEKTFMVQFITIKLKNCLPILRTANERKCNFWEAVNYGIDQYFTPSK